MDVETNSAPSAGDSYMPPVTADQALTVREAARQYTAEMTAKEQPPKNDAVSEAARALSRAGWDKRKEQQAPAVEQAAPVEQKELSATDNGSPAEPVPVETGAPDPAEPPPIDPPRSWTKEHKDAFAALPRDIQERVSESERAREADFLKRQNEATEKLKGLSAKEQQVEQQRQQYEAALPQILQIVQQQGAEFSDIRSMADVERVAGEDPARFVRWQAHQQKLGAVAQEIQAVEQQRTQETSTRWKSFADEQDKLITEKVPDLADPAKAPKLRESAISALRDYGFADEEMGDLYNGQRGVSLRDHRIQLALLDAVKWRDAQAKAKQVTAVQKPPVLRPGTTPNKGAHSEAQAASIRKELEGATGARAIRLATQLHQLERSSR